MIQIATVSLFVVLFGQLGFTAASYYLGIQNPSIPFWASLYGALSLAVVVRGITLRISNLDLMFFACFGLVLLSFTISGESRNTTFAYYFVFFVVGPYLCGRLLASHFSRSLIPLLYGLTILLLFLIALEFMRAPALFSTDRLLIFAPENAEYIAAGTAFFVGTLFGSAFVVSLTSLIIVKSKNRKEKTITIGMLLISTIILLLWGSRGNAVAALVVAGTLLLRYASWTRIMLYSLGLGSLIALVYFNLSPDRRAFIDQIPIALATIGQSAGCLTQGESIVAHLTLYAEAFRLFAQSPIFGIGASNFGFYYCGLPTELASPHSSLLHVLAEFGLVGTMLWSITLVSVLLVFFQAEKRADRERRIALWYVFALWLFTLLEIQTSGDVYYDYHFYLLSGLLVAGLVERRRVRVPYNSQHDPLREENVIPAIG